MTPEQFERLETVLEALRPEIKNLGGRAPEFVQDQIDRAAQYGSEMRLSVKQAEWLENLYAKQCGVTLKILKEDEATREETLGEDKDDLDDEIPF